MEENPYRPSEADYSETLEEQPSTFRRYLRRGLLALGGVALLVVGLMVLAGLQVGKSYLDFKDIGEPYIRGLLVEQSTWDAATLTPRMSSALRAELTAADIDGMVAFFGRLGPLVSIDSVQMTTCSAYASTEHGKIRGCDYLVDVRYESGPAQAEIGLVLEDHQLKLAKVMIHSDVFAPAPPSAQP